MDSKFRNILAVIGAVVVGVVLLRIVFAVAALLLRVLFSVAIVIAIIALVMHFVNKNRQGQP